ncbi:PD-(D/E)XK nuclease family protein [Kribbella sp. NPDC051587]|uniref:PD-(D/E)XK nuclease family protein n=1 Tax=Kribbella sp. NPDC051587 TaxID=3364119 RepID=UPI00378FF39E
MLSDPDSLAPPGTSQPVLRYALPVGNETRWSDLLAVLIATDPEPLIALLELDAAPKRVQVGREIAISAADRPDILIQNDGRTLAVIEVKVLAGLGPRQLDRYIEAAPDAERYALIMPAHLPIHLPAAGRWLPVTWESVLDAYQRSSNQWVVQTAVAWLEHLGDCIPAVGADTPWNALRPGEDFVIALRTRMSWIYRSIHPKSPIEHDLTTSSAGVSSVTRMCLPAQKDGYWVVLEAEERLPVRDYPKYAATVPENKVQGPSVRISLLQQDVITSAQFDWDYLLAMWPLMAAARADWVTASARPRAPHDRAGHQAIIAKGAPPYLGVGFGEGQTKQSAQCLFGARFQLPPDVTLVEVVKTLESTADLLINMADVIPPVPAQT